MAGGKHLSAICSRELFRQAFQHMVGIWVIMSTMLKTGVLRRMEKHDLQSYLEFIIRIEASSPRELAEADLIDKNAKPYNLPTEEMERLYLSNGGFKPPAPFLSCAKCGHNLVNERDPLLDTDGSTACKFASRGISSGAVAAQSIRHLGLLRSSTEK